MYDNDKMNEYMKARWQKRKQNAIDKLGGRCYTCGSVENLEFDHIDPSTKSFTIAKASSFSEERFQTELAKCQLLCRSCHEVKTLKDLGRVSAKDQHGTLSSYRYCKCALCRKAWNEHIKEYKRKRRLS